MKRISPSKDWRPSWKKSYQFDLLEVYGERPKLGYSLLYKLRSSIIIKSISRYLQRGSSILEIAAAQGNFSIRLSDMGYMVTWNDIRTDLIGYVKLKDELGGISFVPGNCLEVKFDRLFDCLLLGEVIEHVAYPDKFLKSLVKLVRKGGFIVLTTPNGEYFKNSLPKYSDFPNPEIFERTQFGPDGDDHIFLLHESELRGWSSSLGLDVLRYDFFGNPLTCGHIKLQKLLSLLPGFIVKKTEIITQFVPPRLKRKLCYGSCLVLRVPE